MNEVDWDEVFAWWATVDKAHDAVCDLQIRLLLLEGKSEESERLQLLRIKMRQQFEDLSKVPKQRGAGK